MIEWFRAETDIRSNKKFVELGMSLRLPRDIARAAALGLYMALLANVADHKPSGFVGDEPDEVIEEWAGWRGEPGLFAPEFRRLFTSEGELTGWQKRQGKLIATQEAKKQADRDRMSQRRRSDVAATEAPEARDKVPYGNGNKDSTTSSSSARDTLVLAMKPMSRERFAGAERMWREGAQLGPGLSATDADIELACADWLQAHPEETPAPVVMRKFVERAIRERLANADRPIPTKPLGAFMRKDKSLSIGEAGYIAARRSVGLPDYPEDENAIA